MMFTCLLLELLSLGLLVTSHPHLSDRNLSDKNLGSHSHLSDRSFSVGGYPIFDYDYGYSYKDPLLQARDAGYLSGYQDARYGRQNAVDARRKEEHKSWQQMIQRYLYNDYYSNFDNQVRRAATAGETSSYPNSNSGNQRMENYEIFVQQDYSDSARNTQNGALPGNSYQDQESMPTITQNLDSLSQTQV
ncbi:hypothetical protein Ciccas_000529 [Cichlidogyrus casuarinus]|uniref:Uncharacterized protein n=1 Tax=Cichlidogyrus casuarinus TaxID=1844966 RepID=A0ABD2QMM3_9PLAT